MISGGEMRMSAGGGGMVAEWQFTLQLNREMTEAEADAFDGLDEPLFADGSVSYTMDGPGPSRLLCAVEAATGTEAVAKAATAVRRLPGLRAVAAERDDLLTLAEAAERLPEEKLTAVVREVPPAGETDGTPYWSWSRITAELRALGHDVPDADRDITLADLALRTAYALDTAAVPGPVRRALGL